MSNDLSANRTGHIHRSVLAYLPHFYYRDLETIRTKGKNMSKLKSLSVAAFFSALFFGFAGTAMAQTQSTGEIRGIGTGWNQDQFIAYVPAGTITAATNPAGCPNPDGYASKIDYSGYKTHLSTVQLAFALGKPLTFTVSNTPSDCLDGRPRLIGVALYK
jgi:hypothetical protein